MFLLSIPVLSKILVCSTSMPTVIIGSFSRVPPIVNRSFSLSLDNLSLAVYNTILAPVCLSTSNSLVFILTCSLGVLCIQVVVVCVCV